VPNASVRRTAPAWPDAEVQSFGGPSDGATRPSIRRSGTSTRRKQGGFSVCRRSRFFSRGGQLPTEETAIRRGDRGAAATEEQHNSARSADEPSGAAGRPPATTILPSFVSAET